MGKRIWTVLVLALVSALLAGCTRFATLEAPTGSLEAFAPPPGVPGAAHAPDQILVKFKPGVLPERAAAVHARRGGQVIHVIPGIEVHVVRIPQGRVPEMVRAYLLEELVEFAEPDYVAVAYLVPNDPGYAYQWALPKIQAPQAWDLTTGSSAIRIAILDTGIDQDHEDLRAKIVANRNFTTSPTVDDRQGHGTHVAGIAAAVTNNARGVAGVGFNAVLMNVKVLDDNGSGQYSWIANGIVWAADNGAHVINMSLGGPATSSTLEAAVRYAYSRGVVLVAAAGNENTSSPSYPAYYPECIAVAATDQNDAKASFSNYGAWVDIAAPGVSIYSTLPNHTNRTGVRNYGYLSGTSMAAPHVAGVAALIKARYPALTNAQIAQRLLATGDPTTGFTTAIRRVNAYRAVQ
ncbi:MAG: S8 family peptidase [Candidatus Bipolaricaulota bacterium]|nr:S8 family peptidase [Candidatus Bipolaricaulota bacterium]MDW8151608.1 S8 family peptidase [Candidatus Bipolaricaulota bacterium]